MCKHQLNSKRSIKWQNDKMPAKQKHSLWKSINWEKSTAPCGIVSSTSVLMQIIPIFLFVLSTAARSLSKVFGVPIMNFALLSNNWRWISSVVTEHEKIAIFDSLLSIQRVQFQTKKINDKSQNANYKWQITNGINWIHCCYNKSRFNRAQRCNWKFWNVW